MQTTPPAVLNLTQQIAAGTAQGFWFWALLVCLLCFALELVCLLVLLVSALNERRVQARLSAAEDYQTLVQSRFTIPVSLLATACNEASGIVAATRSLLEIEYPEHEVIVVNDGSSDQTLELLKKEFDLQPRAVFYRWQIKCETVRAVYFSPHEPRLIVVDKRHGGKADALNCGVNLSKYPYVCSMDTDTIYLRDALLKAMRPIMRDPETVVGVTANVATVRHPARDKNGRFQRHLWSNFQHLDNLHAFQWTRLAWNRRNAVICVTGTFALWRRDVVQELGGFSSGVTGEDLEMTLRAHEKMLSENKPYRIVALPDTVAHTEGPDQVLNFIDQRARWQRSLLENAWNHRRLLFRPRYRAVGGLAMPFCVLLRALSPVFRLLALAAVAGALWFRVLSAGECLLLFGSLMFAFSLTTTVALFGDSQNIQLYRLRDLVYLLAITPLKFVLYYPVVLYAQCVGLIGFLLRDGTWHRFERNSRAPLPAATKTTR
jgi:cellulose synthase/poly-beta-1,6-N-acetylglucosamine synthase-like glycosyltransferase